MLKYSTGSYKQYIVSPENYTTLIPDGVSDYIAGPVMCSAATTYTSLKEANLNPGEWAVFPGGGGGVGIQGVQLAYAMGLRPIVVDTGSERAELCKKYGAEHFVDFKEGDPVKQVVELTGGGAHAVFVTAVQSYPIAPQYLGSRVGGQVMCIGLPPAGKYNIDLAPASLIFRGQSIKGTLVSSLGDLDKTLEFAQRGKSTNQCLCCRVLTENAGKLHLEPTIVGLSGWNDAVQKLKRSEIAGRVVVDFNKP